MRSATQLIAYADRFGGTLCGLRSLLDNELEGLFGGVHILPFFDPIDGADAGFDPTNHLNVDARLGSWDDIADIAANYSVMADVIVNHMSADSPQFRDVLDRGSASVDWELFLRKQDIFPGQDASSDNFSRIYRPRSGAPFTTIELSDGSCHEFWTTFSARQLDINVESRSGAAYLQSIIEKFAGAGIGEIRMDAAGYAIKRRGTSCFMLPETFEFITHFSSRAAELDISTLVEIHSHYQTQVAIASTVGRVYDFALPPLVLHTLYSNDSEPLKRWLRIAPRNCVNVLDTHDGIGILDVARQGENEGLLADADVEALVETIHKKTGGSSRRASGHAASNLDIYQVNSTYYDALGGDDCDYLIARAIQLFSPGRPQIYYVGLLAGANDDSLVEQTGVGRDINRHHYTLEEIQASIQRPVVSSLFELIRIRNSARALNGEFSLPECSSTDLILSWNDGTSSACLQIDLSARQATITLAEGDEVRNFTIDGNRLFQTAD